MLQDLEKFRVETGSKNIYAYENIFDSNTCRQVYEYMLMKKRNNIYELDGHSMPWHKGDTIAFNIIDDVDIKHKLECYRYLTTQIVSHCFNTIVWPHFSDLVLWRPGRSMEMHKDNGYLEDPNQVEFTVRKFTCVSYMNDDYTGGETFIKREDGSFYESIPKTGSMVCFYSDERCEHGVRQVKGSKRVAFTTWFCTDIESAGTWVGNPTFQM